MFMGLSSRQLGGVFIVSLGAMFVVGWAMKPATAKEGK